MKNRLYVQLGRIGDILNILPLCKRDFDRSGVRPLLMVAKPFLPLLEGVSYVEPVGFGGRFEEVSPALQYAFTVAKDRDAEVVCTQIYGEGLVSLEHCSSFMRESWDRVPDAPAWGSLPLEFDRRDRDRERGVCEQLRRGSTRPYIVLALDGTSSPLATAPAIRQAIRSAAKDEFDVIDISGFVAPRFYDLLTLFEEAACIVASDSAPLHLAHATPHVPVVAFITRSPSHWHGSPARPSHAVRFYYDEAGDEFLWAITRFVTKIARKEVYVAQICHVWTHFGDIDADARRRMEFARRTWQQEYDANPGRWRSTEFKATDCLRDSGAAPISDPRPIPFWKDLIRHACDVAVPEDAIALTNSDVCFTPGITGLIDEHLARYGCAYTHRYDFYRPLDTPLRSEAEVARGDWYPGSDAFFFTVKWWRQHADEYPDMLLGREQCDEVLRQLIKRHGGCEIPCAIYHEKHPSFWEHFGNRENNPGNQYNRALAQKWFLRTGYGPNDPKWWRPPGLQPVGWTPAER